MTKSKNPGLTRRASGLMALEQRFMFDGAAVADALQVVEAQVVQADVAEAIKAAEPLPLAVAQVQQQAQQKIAEYLNGATDQQIFELFNGGKEAPDAAWADRLAQLRDVLNMGELPVQFVAMDQASQFTAVAAFTLNGPDGKPTIFINPFWAGLLDNQDMTQVVVEELGHWMDQVLNEGADTAGDEGERFAQVVTQGSALQSAEARVNDTGWVQVAGVSYEVEFASFNFVNAYEMVYDLNGNGLVVGSTGETAAAKEQSRHNFHWANPLGTVRIVDGYSSRTFSGNDVSATTIRIGSTDHYGWISRPIKSGGIVRGFYFWTDAHFATLADARADGNNDNDGEGDNRGFLLVVDQAWFDGQINDTKTATTTNIDGVSGLRSYATIGSSSDRVDTALNGLLTPNSVSALADTLTVLEDSGANAGNLLTNDSDADGDTFTVTGFSVGGTNYTPSSTPRTITGVGTITINANGSYSFTPQSGYVGPVPVISYTITDAFGATSSATLSIAVSDVNDAPAGTDKTITTRENTAYALTSADFGFTDPSDTPPDNFASVIITTLPTAGNLTLNGTAVTAGQEVNVAALAGLRYQPAYNSNGTGYASMTFQVRDNGGITNSGINLDASPNTLTFNVQAVNSAPTAVADTTTVGEAGGVNNTTNLTPNVTGDVLTNDTDSDASDSKTVTTVAGLNTGTVGSSVAGKYGSLVLNADGTYTYTVDNSNLTVQALRLVSNTLSDVFTYTVTDGGGLTSTTTLSITITGANDHPVAEDDYDAVKEAATATSGVWGSTTGTVIPNDGDLDGGALVVESVSTTTGDVDTLKVTSPITSATYTVVDVSTSGNWTSGVNNNSSSPQTVQISGVNVQRSDGAGLLTVYRSGSGGGASLIFNHAATLYSYATSTVFGVTGSANTFFRITSIIPTVSSSTILDVTSGNIANIAVGDTVSGSGISAGTTVASINASANKVTLSQAAQITSRDITFTGSGGSTSSQNITAGSSTTLTGNYGNLILASSGAYTYNLTNNSLNDGQTATEAFTYTVNDSAGGTDTAVLYIRIDGRSAVAVNAADDTHNVNEDATLTVAASAGVLANDTASSTVSSYTWGAVTTTVGSPVTYPDVGTLTLNANGSFTFVPTSNFSGTVPPVVYTISNGAGKASAVLDITVNPVNDGPTAVADTTEAREAGGYSNEVLGYNPSGNLLNNDTDPERNALSVTAIGHSTGSGTVGQPRAGTYGSLTLNSDGSYSYTVSNSSAVVQALAAGQIVTDVFNYTASDGSLTSTSSLTVTVRGANDAPINTVPSTAVAANMGSSTPISGVSVADVDNNSVTVTLSVASGTLSLGTTTGLSFSSGSNGQATMTFSGSKTDINTALTSLSYAPGASFISADTLSIQTVDAGGLQDSDTVQIGIVDNRALTVTGTTVNEASPYVVFRISGAAGQSATFSLGSTSSTVDTDAEQGKDFLPNLQYFDGTNWQNYTGAAVAFPSGNTLLVRAPVNQDSSYEGAETLTLTASNQAGTNSTPGVSTIVDDGTGAIFLANNNSFTPNNSSNTGYPTYLDDDRPVTVNSVVVNEASPYAVFTVTGVAGQTLQLSMIDGTALVGTDTAAATSFEVFNGSGWLNYTAGSDLILAGSSLQVRLALTQDTTFEQGETFFLSAKQMGSGVTAYGKATILDDGNGSKFVFDNDNNPANDPQSPTTTTGPGAGFDDDRPLGVTAFGPVNEGSTYAMFTVTAADGYALDLSLGGTAASTDAEAAYAGFTVIEYSTDGTNWSIYSNSNKPTVPVSGNVYVRVTITSESDSSLEGAEGFALKAAYSSNTVKSATGETTIVDDGTGKKYGPNMPSGTPAESTTGLDDDRSVSVTAFGPVNEASTYAMFTVDAVAGYKLDLSVQSATAGTSAAIAGFTSIGWSTDGTSWTTYASANKPTVPAGGKVYVRVDISSESDLNFEGSETFALKAAYTTNTGNSAAADTSIVDDGTGKKYGPNMPSGTPTESTTGLDDDRGPSVNSITVNEGSPWAVFEVLTTTGCSISGFDINSSATNVVRTNGQSIQYWAGSGPWQDTTTSGMSLNLTAGQKILVRVNIISERDDTLEGREAFQLQVISNGLSGTVTGTGTIVDDGTGVKYPDATPASGPMAVTETTNLDDDRAITVSGLDDISESSNAVFTVTLPNGNTRDTEISLALSNGSGANDAEADDYSSTFTAYYYDSNNTQQPLTITSGKVTLPAGVTAFYVKVPTTQDFAQEGAESFSLTATITGGKSGSDTSTILDNGTGKVYDNRGLNPTGPGDDDRAITVSGGTYNEASPRAVFTVTANNGLLLTLDVKDVADTGKSPTGSNAGVSDDLDTADIFYSVDNGANWVKYTGAAFAAGAQPVLVAVDITREADTPYEGEEQLQLVVNSGLSTEKNAFSSIKDDGTGTVTQAITQNTINDTGANDSSVVKDDDRVLIVSNVTANEGSPYVVFTVSGGNNQQTTLSLANQNADGANLTTLQYFDGNNWQNYTANQVVSLNGSGILLVRVALSPEQDMALDGPETFNLVATNTGGSASTGGLGTIKDDGTGDYFAANNNTATPALLSGVVLDDDNPKPAALPPVPVVPTAPPAPPAVLVAPLPVAVPAQSFASALTPLAQSLGRAEPPMALPDAVTSGSGYQIPVSETAPVGLNLYQGVTDQFVQSTNAATRISLPFDAFIHSSKDAVIRLQAKQADDSNLPSWVQFDPATGVFIVTPPANFKGKLDLKVLARDDDGREAVAMFQMFIGEQTAPQVQSRDSFSEKLKMAGKRQITLVRVADGANKVPVREVVPTGEAAPVRVRAG